MSDPEPLARHSDGAFVPATPEPWARREARPPLGKVAPGFPRWPRSGGATRQVAAFVARPKPA